MTNQEFEREINVGGSLETALSGKYKLSFVDTYREAFHCTVKHLAPFSPAVILLIAIQVAIFLLSLTMQMGDLNVYLNAFDQQNGFTSQMFEALFISSFSFEVVTAPIYAGVQLMAMSHTAGLQTKTRHLMRGLQFTLPVIVVTLTSLLLQGIVGMVFSLLSVYLSIAFSQSILLVCEKRVPPLKAMFLSLRASNKKLLPLIGIYLVASLLFMLALLFTYGFALILFIPFYLHLKGIIYREMFGIRLTIVARQGNNESKTFDA